VIICPVCGTRTGVITDNHGRRPVAVLYAANAAWPRDGYRCEKHARTLKQRSDESAAALEWVKYR
jgi:hypothetical protein